MNVLEAAQRRISYVFEHFDNAYVAFSGGKDSGVLTHLIADHLRSLGPDSGKRCTIVFIDLEGCYRRTEQFVEHIIDECADVMDAMWICLPMHSENGVSIIEPYWTFWDETKCDRWIRPMPKHNCVINSKNNPFNFFHDTITFEEFINRFGTWLANQRGTKIASFIGIRTQESLRRWYAINRDKKQRFEDCRYSAKISQTCYNFYPIYDWLVEDIWTYNGRFNKSYNETYDMFQTAGVPLMKQRICEPFGTEQKAGINMFKVIEPETWVRLLDRVSGVNFGNIYCGTKALGMRGAALPPGHTWKSYCKFLLRTLPQESQLSYTRRFVTFMKWWHRQGSPCLIEHIAALPPDLIVNTKTRSRRGSGDKDVIRFKRVADELPGLDAKSDFPTWKRMCMAILKNDIACKSLHFGLTKDDMERRKNALLKYKGL